MVTSSWRLQKRVSDGESNVKKVKSKANRDKESWPTSQKNDSSYEQFPDPPAPTHMWQLFNLRFIQNFRMWNLERWQENQNCTWSVESYKNKYEWTLNQASFLPKASQTEQDNQTLRMNIYMDNFLYSGHQNLSTSSTLAAGMKLCKHLSSRRCCPYGVHAAVKTTGPVRTVKPYKTHDSACWKSK